MLLLNSQSASFNNKGFNSSDTMLEGSRLWMHFTNLESLYIITMGIGIIVSILGVLLGGIHFHSDHFMHAGHSMDTGHSIHTSNSSHATIQDSAVATVPILNVQAIFAFMIGFGSTGLIASLTFNPTILSLVFAVPGGLLCWYIIRLILGAMLKNQTNFMTTTTEDAIGRTAIVVSKIFPNSVGEVMYTSEGANNIIRAKYEQSESVAKGVSVVVLKVENNIAVVALESSQY